MSSSILFLALACALIASSCSSSKKNDGEVASDDVSSFVVTSIKVTNTVDTQFDEYTTYTNSLSDKLVTATQQWDQGFVGSQTFELNGQGQPIALTRTTTYNESTDTVLTEAYVYNEQGLLKEATQNRDSGITSKSVYTWSSDNKLELESEEHFDRPEHASATSRREVDYQYDEQGELTNVFSSYHFIGGDEIIYREDYSYNASDNSAEILTYRLPSESPEDRRVEFKDDNENLVKVENYDSDGGLRSTVVITYESVVGPAFNVLEFPRLCIVNVGSDCGV